MNAPATLSTPRGTAQAPSTADEHATVLAVEIEFLADTSEKAEAKRVKMAREIAEYILEREDVFAVDVGFLR